MTTFRRGIVVMRARCAPPPPNHVICDPKTGASCALRCINTNRCAADSRESINEQKLDYKSFSIFYQRLGNIPILRDLLTGQCNTLGHKTGAGT
ncbi:hypothetical protein EVAR_60369_1 [Eumeta japonica]|uniref:Uncharacterized protein n=1 Tax=Eumeta variegata TaxID=151549 RepID=A0A4C1SKU4_EUMVA|nr:hypothetical protein EVAR_60369_1 [Eumeta japonica]